jgi:hypothetical protein
MTSAGPIIYEATKVSWAADSSFCGAGTERLRVHVKAYRTTGTFPTTDAAFAADLHYVLTNGNESTGVATQIEGRSVTNSNRNAEWNHNFCVSSTLTQFTGALHFVNGNEFCFVIPK